MENVSKRYLNASTWTLRLKVMAAGADPGGVMSPQTAMFPIPSNSVKELFT